MQQVDRCSESTGRVTTYFIYLSGAARASILAFGALQKNKGSAATGMRRAAAQPACRISGQALEAVAYLLATTLVPYFRLLCQASPQLCRQKGAKTTSNRARQLDSHRLCIRFPSRRCCHSLPRPIGRAEVCHPAPLEREARRGTGVFDSIYTSVA